MIPLCDDQCKQILHRMRRWPLFTLLAATTAAPSVSARAQSRCVAAVQPFDAPARIVNRADSASFSAPLTSRDAVACVTTMRSGSTARLRMVWPTVSVGAAAGVPDTRSDGALWAGRGMAALLRAGFTIDIGPLHGVLVPEFWAAQNRPYDILASSAISLDSSRSPLASPFYYGPHSLDLPSRLGVAPLRVASPGQSAAWIEGRGVSLGVSTSNSWWGPGVRDGLILGPGAAGIPRVFLRTARPVRTALGSWSGEWLVGTLTESLWFDADASNDRRTISAARLEWSPRNTPGLVLGVMRATQSPQPRTSSSRGAFDVWQSSTVTNSDQMAGVFASVTTSDFRAYLEIASPHPPAGIRSFLAAPGDDRAYQLGVERRIVRGPATWLLHAEVMNADPGVSIRDRPARDFYAGRAVPHGWTHRGQLLGAGIGPGGTAQWFAVDRTSPRLSLGVFAERVRWNNEVLTRLYLPTIFRHDVTTRFGVRGVRRTVVANHAYDIAVTASLGNRINYLFQNLTYIRDFRTVDVRVPQFQLTVSPR